MSWVAHLAGVERMPALATREPDLTLARSSPEQSTETAPGACRCELLSSFDTPETLRDTPQLLAF